jgi:hypothetical protein
MKTIVGCLLLCCLAYCSNVRGHSLEHVDRLAVEVRERANLVCWELFGTCRGRPGYDQIYRDAKEVWSIAGHIHDLVHNSANLSRIQRNAVELDQMLAKVRMQIAAWGDTNQFHGPFPGQTFVLQQKLAGLEQAVQHLMGDVGVPRQMPGSVALGGQPMMPAGLGPMPGGAGPMPSQVGSFFPSNMESMMPQTMPTMPVGYNPQGGMPFFPGMGR